PGGSRVERSHVVAAEDILPDASLLGTILLLFSDRTAGQSTQTIYSARFDPAPPQEPRVGPLANRLLSLPRGGALAVLGHIDQLWLTSFRFEAEYGFALMEKLLRRLLDGHTIGSAGDLLGQRYNQLRARLDDVLRAAFLDRQRVDEKRLDQLRIAMLDARNYAV